ncbi:hypothetical protein SAMN05428949_3898 [Chitinophaga sp. YR627]|uniref:hypothetical protein n=1 Tax=Chitinophaga sp. YR627 TaxID=1881041 RepID=UPI0008E16C7D|nr:hypothetical protein [Chitinophaga sp. YR627]SFN93380.1 hypothetical protein SAMN05428949_3898 [Chitinophaga sp. YR627]
MKTITPKIVFLSVIREQFDVSQYDLIKCLDEGNVLLFDGDMDTDWTETIYELKALEYLDLRYNKFSEEDKKKITQGFPKATIEF